MVSKGGAAWGGRLGLEAQILIRVNKQESPAGEQKNSIKYPVINHNWKEYKKECVCVCIYMCVRYTHTHIYN